MFMCVKLNVLFDREMKVYYVTQVLNQHQNNVRWVCHLEQLLTFENFTSKKESHSLRGHFFYNRLKLSAFVQTELLFVTK